MGGVPGIPQTTSRLPTSGSNETQTHRGNQGPFSTANLPPEIAELLIAFLTSGYDPKWEEQYDQLMDSGQLDEEQAAMVEEEKESCIKYQNEAEGGGGDGSINASSSSDDADVGETDGEESDAGDADVGEAGGEGSGSEDSGGEG